MEPQYPQKIFPPRIPTIHEFEARPDGRAVAVKTLPMIANPSDLHEYYTTSPGDKEPIFHPQARISYASTYEGLNACIYCEDRDNDNQPTVALRRTLRTYIELHLTEEDAIFFHRYRAQLAERSEIADAIAAQVEAERIYNEAQATVEAALARSNEYKKLDHEILTLKKTRNPNWQMRNLIDSKQGDMDRLYETIVRSTGCSLEHAAQEFNKKRSKVFKKEGWWWKHDKKFAILPVLTETFKDHKIDPHREIVDGTVSAIASNNGGVYLLSDERLGLNAPTGRPIDRTFRIRYEVILEALQPHMRNRTVWRRYRTKEGEFRYFATIGYLGDDADFTKIQSALVGVFTPDGGAYLVIIGEKTLKLLALNVDRRLFVHEEIAGFMDEIKPLILDLEAERNPQRESDAEWRASNEMPDAAPDQLVGDDVVEQEAASRTEGGDQEADADEHVGPTEDDECLDGPPDPLASTRAGGSADSQPQVSL